jgi:hypothetical protein
VYAAQSLYGATKDAAAVLLQDKREVLMDEEAHAGAIQPPPGEVLSCRNYGAHCAELS